MRNDSTIYTLTKWRRARLQWRAFWSILYAMNRRGELLRLIRWATRKNLAGPLKCYQSRLEDEDRRLLRYACHSPALVAWARKVYWVKRMVFPAPWYHARGSAALYSRRGMLNKTRVL